MTCSSKDEEPGFYSSYYALKELAAENADYFKGDASSSGSRLYNSCCKIANLIDPSIELINHVSSNASRFDFDEKTKANGYRSFILAMEHIVKKTSHLSRTISANRTSYFFRKSYYSREIESCCQVLESLVIMLKHLQTLIGWSQSGHLFPDSEHKPDELLGSQPQFVNQYSFYGRCIGFQFCESIALIFKALAILMASFSEFYYSGGKMMDFLLNGSKYLIDPELRARRIVNISQYASVDFCKTFWFLGEMELMQRLPSMSFTSLAVNRVILIEQAPLTMQCLKDGTPVEIPIPSSHKPPAAIPVRLLSASYYFGMDDIPKKEGVKEASLGLVFHCHGGGFVAQSSRSHETYLRQWALSIPAPILSVDYSLAPEAPFPRALEEIYYAYCWALSNAHTLGSRADKIILAGDSAGANLNLALTLKCIETGIRPPDGIFIAYAPVVLNFVPSPARLLCLMDPLLPFGFLMGCTKAYACPPEFYNASKAHEYKLERNIILKSPLVENGQTCSKTDILSPEDNSEEGAEAEESGEPVLMERKGSLPILTYLTAIMSALSSKFTSKMSSSTSLDTDKADTQRIEEEMRSEAFLPCPTNMMAVEVPKDLYISPYYAPDSLLKCFPPISILTVHFDPFLDDCIEFARKLKSLEVPVTLDVLDGLSHGFLNFSMICREASDGSKVCINRINTLLFSDAFEA